MAGVSRVVIMNYDYKVLFPDHFEERYGNKHVFAKKNRVSFLNQRKNSFKIKKFRNDPYDFEHSPNVVKKPVLKPPGRYKKQNLSAELGYVEGIFTSFMKLPPILKKIEKSKELSLITIKIG